MAETAITQIFAPSVSVDPKVIARELGLVVGEIRDVPFTSGSEGDTLIYCWDESSAVRNERIWAGIAQCLLRRLGVEWSQAQAEALAGWLQLAGQRRA